MIKKGYRYLRVIVFTIAIFLHGIVNIGSASSISPDTLNFNDIRVLENGYLEITDGDPYIVFPEVEKPFCNSIGLELGISFSSHPVKPVLLEIFWSTEFLGFGEENKIFFTLMPQEASKEYNFIIPLYQSAGLTQIRLDFPKDLATKFRIEDYQITLLEDVVDKSKIIDTFQSLSVDMAQKMDILIPYILQAFTHGFKRLLHDKGFLVFWLLIISSLLICIRKLAVRREE